MNAPPILAATLLALLAVGASLVHDGREPTPPPATDGSLVVMTYNIHQLYSTGKTGQVNLEAVRDVIRASGAHVIGLQESEGARITSGHTNGVRWLAHELGMHAYYGPPTSEQIYGVSVLSAWPLASARWVPLPATESIERVAVLVEVQTPDGPVNFLDTHLQTVEYPSDRRAQVERVLELVQDWERGVVVGDFNTPAMMSDEAYARLNSTLQDAWTMAPDSRNETGITELDEPIPQRIDHVWLQGSWTVESCRRWGDPSASDHLGVACRIRPG